jgi:RNA-binding protein
MRREPDHAPKLSSSERQELIRRGHQLDAKTTVGRQGLSDAFIAQLEQTMRRIELIKIRIEAESNGEAMSIAEELAARLGGQVVQRVGRVALLYRPVVEDANE